MKKIYFYILALFLGNLAFADDFDQMFSCLKDQASVRDTSGLLQNKEFEKFSKSRVLSTCIHSDCKDGPRLKFPAKVNQDTFFWVEEVDLSDKGKKNDLHYIDFSKTMSRYGKISYPRNQKYAVVDISSDDTDHYAVKLPSQSSTFDLGKIDFHHMTKPISATVSAENLNNFDDFGQKMITGKNKNGTPIFASNIVKYGTDIDRIGKVKEREANKTKKDSFDDVKNKMNELVQNSCVFGEKSIQFKIQELNDALSLVESKLLLSDFASVEHLENIEINKEVDYFGIKNSIKKYQEKLHKKMQAAGYFCDSTEKVVADCPMYNKCRNEAKEKGLLFGYKPGLHNHSGQIAIITPDAYKLIHPNESFDDLNVLDSVGAQIIRENIKKHSEIFSPQCKSYVEASVENFEENKKISRAMYIADHLFEEISPSFDAEKARLNCIQSLGSSNDEEIKAMVKKWSEMSCISSNKSSNQNQNNLQLSKPSKTKSLGL